MKNRIKITMIIGAIAGFCVATIAATDCWSDTLFVCRASDYYEFTSSSCGLTAIQVGEGYTTKHTGNQPDGFIDSHQTVETDCGGTMTTVNDCYPYVEHSLWSIPYEVERGNSVELCEHPG